MNTSAADDPRDPLFLKSVDSVRRTMGKRPLEDDDLFLLACESISRTYTYEERNYGSSSREQQ
ncbi:MAG: hypothetical protein JW768_16000 [Chitinispirillaceae bacterium]|nr:hypothetical protein [Chitinispirillaceae bacterium]